MAQPRKRLPATSAIDPARLDLNVITPCPPCPPDRRRLTALVALALDLARRQLADEAARRRKGGAA